MINDNPLQDKKFEGVQKCLECVEEVDCYPAWRKTRNDNLKYYTNKANDKRVTSLEALCKPVTVNLTRLSPSELRILTKLTTNGNKKKNLCVKRKRQGTSKVIAKRHSSKQKTKCKKGTKKSLASSNSSNAISYFRKGLNNENKKAHVEPDCRDKEMLVEDSLRDMKEPVVKLVRIDKIVNKLADSFAKITSCNRSERHSNVQCIQEELQPNISSASSLDNSQSNNQCLTNSIFQSVTYNSGKNGDPQLTGFNDDSDDSDVIGSFRYKKKWRRCLRKNPLRYSSESSGSDIVNDTLETAVKSVTKRPRLSLKKSKGICKEHIFKKDCENYVDKQVSQMTTEPLEIEFAHKNVSTMPAKTTSVFMIPEDNNSVDGSVKNNSASTSVLLKSNTPVKENTQKTRTDDSTTDSSSIGQKILKVFKIRLSELGLITTDSDNDRLTKEQQKLRHNDPKITQNTKRFYDSSNDEGKGKNSIVETLCAETLLQNSSKEAVQNVGNMITEKKIPKNKNSELSHSDKDADVSENLENALDINSKETCTSNENAIKSASFTGILDNDTSTAAVDKLLKDSTFGTKVELLCTPQKGKCFNSERKTAVIRSIESVTYGSNCSLNQKKGFKANCAIISPEKCKRFLGKKDSMEIIHKCIVCDLCFKNYTSLQHHLVMHAKTRRNPSNNSSMGLFFQSELCQENPAASIVKDATKPGQVSSKNMSNSGEEEKRNGSEDSKNKGKKDESVSASKIDLNKCMICSKGFPTVTELTAHHYVHVKNDLNMKFEIEEVDHLQTNTEKMEGVNNMCSTTFDKNINAEMLIRILEGTDVSTEAANSTTEQTECIPNTCTMVATQITTSPNQNESILPMQSTNTSRTVSQKADAFEGGEKSYMMNQKTMVDSNLSQIIAAPSLNNTLQMQHDVVSNNVTLMPLTTPQNNVQRTVVLDNGDVQKASNNVVTEKKNDEKIEKRKGYLRVRAFEELADPAKLSAGSNCTLNRNTLPSHPGNCNIVVQAPDNGKHLHQHCNMCKDPRICRNVPVQLNCHVEKCMNSCKTPINCVSGSCYYIHNSVNPPTMSNHVTVQTETTGPVHAISQGASHATYQSNINLTSGGMSIHINPTNSNQQNVLTTNTVLQHGQQQIYHPANFRGTVIAENNQPVQRQQVTIHHSVPHNPRQMTNLSQNVQTRPTYLPNNSKIIWQQVFPCTLCRKYAPIFNSADKLELHESLCHKVKK